jgi:hypothetical protein
MFQLEDVIAIVRSNERTLQTKKILGAENAPLCFDVRLDAVPPTVIIPIVVHAILNTRFSA